MKPGSNNAVEDHPQLNHNGHPLDGALVGTGRSPWMNEVMQLLQVTESSCAIFQPWNHFTGCPKLIADSSLCFHLYWASYVSNWFSLSILIVDNISWVKIKVQQCGTWDSSSCITRTWSLWSVASQVVQVLNNSTSYEVSLHFSGMWLNMCDILRSQVYYIFIDDYRQQQLTVISDSRVPCQPSLEVN